MSTQFLVLQQIIEIMWEFQQYSQILQDIINSKTNNRPSSLATLQKYLNDCKHIKETNKNFKK